MTSLRFPSLLTLMIAASSHAAEQKEVQDMSDPLAVYTQVGVGATNKGLNFHTSGMLKHVYTMNVTPTSKH